MSDWLVMILIAFVLSVNWPVYIYLNYPEFSQFIANKESSAWINRTVKPFYYYWSFPAQSGIWALLASITLVFPYARKRIDEFGFGNYKFLAIWTWSAVILMSLFPEKKARYLLPVLLPLSLMTAFYCRYLIEAFKKTRNTTADTLVFTINGFLIASISFAAPVTAWFIIDKNGFYCTIWFKLFTLLFFWTLALVMVWSTINKKPFALWASMVILVSSGCVLFMGHARKF